MRYWSYILFLDNIYKLFLYEGGGELIYEPKQNDIGV